ncbi:MAG: hypothetical protein MI717_10210 [Spirochaetales bacterium]|nr:hypothetical protein [Spirochaetales bacterium]
MKRGFLLLGMLLVTASLVSAQEFIAHYVIIEDAQAEIAELEADNQRYEQMSVTFQEDIDRHQAVIDESEAFISRVDEVLPRISASAGQIYTVLQGVMNEDTRQQILDRVEENRKSRYELESKLRDEYQVIATATHHMENSKKRIAMNRVHIKANNQRIEYLRACIAYSERDGDGVEPVLQAADAVRQEVQQILDSAPIPRA